MAKHKLIGLSTILLALCLLLASCSGKASAQEDFLGTWNIYAVATSEDQEGGIPHEDIVFMQQLGMNASMMFDSNGTYTLDLFGTISSGTWTAKDTKEAEVSLDNGLTFNVYINDDDYLVYSDNDKRLVFSRETVTPVANVDGQTDAQESSEDAEAGATDATADGSETQGNDADAQDGAATDANTAEPADDAAGDSGTTEGQAEAA